jgi:hypothetical protein
MTTVMGIDAAAAEDDPSSDLRSASVADILWAKLLGPEA